LRDGLQRMAVLVGRKNPTAAIKVSGKVGSGHSFV
jgi:hypothetical protein